MKKLLKNFLKTCPQSGKIKGIKLSKYLMVLLFPFIGLLALIWILIRVIPKPSRAVYPCMKVAFPVASGFIVQVLGLFASFFVLSKAKRSFSRSHLYTATLLLFLGSAGFVIISNAMKIFDTPHYQTLKLVNNQPMGEAKGIFPGRVVWVWNPNATNENCTNSSNRNGAIDDSDDGWFLARNNNQEVIDQMLSDGIRELTAKTSDEEAWNAIFQFHNEQRGKGAVDYQPGEIFFIKINATSSWGGNYNTNTLSIVDNANYGIAESNPHLVLALLHQLVNIVGVSQTDIVVGDPLKTIYKHSFDLLSGEFPNVTYLDRNYGSERNRTQSVYTTDPVIHYSDRGTVMHVGDWNDPNIGPPTENDRLVTILQDCEYLLNIPTMKGHKRAGITMFAKNHFGSHGRSNAVHLHGGLVNPTESNAYREEYGLYRVLVDLMGHEMTGKKNLFFLMDALYSGPEAIYKPTKWEMAPFNGDWTSSLFLSQDPVAIESVGYDFLRTEYTSDTPYSWVQMGAVDDYLHQAADSSWWPENVRYDPENDGTVLGSLGVHEHWNNSVDMQYSQNLGTGDGIELIRIFSATDVEDDPDSQLARSIKLFDNYPNPFNPSTTIRYHLAKNSTVELSIYDLSGRVVAQLINEYQSPDFYQVSWNGHNQSGYPVPAGIYFARLSIEETRSTECTKMILMK